MFFTQDDYKKIQQWLTKNSVRDTEFNEANIPFKGEEIITVVQDNQNKKVPLRDLVSQIFNLGVSDFINVTDKYDAPNIDLNEAIKLIPSRARKEGQVITFLNKENNWQIYQFRGVLNQWSTLDKWEDLFDWEKLIINSILPDEEDLTKSLPDENGNSYLSLKDREYNPEDFSGLGRIILRKNVVDIEDPIYGKVKKNILYQDMFTQSNTIYEIRYDFDLNGQEITIPEGCVLDFQGGSLSNGNIVGNNTVIKAPLLEILNNIELIGKWKTNTWYPEWFKSINDQEAIDCCIEILNNTGGGVLHLTNIYNADIIIDRTNFDSNLNFSLIIEGEGFNKTYLNGEDSARITLKANLSNVIQFTVRDICIQGPGGANPNGIGINLPIFATNCSFERIHFNGLHTCLKLAHTYLCTFQTLKFRNYIVGITGTENCAANNNIFSNVNFGDGTKNGTNEYVTCPIISTGMGYNCYIACDFEASYTIKTIDMRGGSGYDNFIKCRFERLNRGSAPWIQLGNNQNIDRCEFWPSSDHSHNNYIIEVYGKNNVINPLSIEGSTHGSKTVWLTAGSQNTKVEVVFPNPEPYGKFIADVITDEGINNHISHVNCTTVNNINTQGKVPILQWITDNINLTTANHTDNISFGENMRGSLTLEKNKGVKSYGNVFIVNRRDANSGKVWWTNNCSKYYKYIFSIFILCEQASRVRIFAEQDSFSDSYIYELEPNKWKRIYICSNYGNRVDGATVNFGLENIEEHTLYVQYPQLEEYPQKINIVMPQQLVLNPNNTYCMGFEDGYDKAPVAGRHCAGEFIRNINFRNNPNIFGWVCKETGVPGTWSVVSLTNT